ncbi:MAG TPA: hypothetical protein VIS94_09115 [Desulfomonilia bacterium]|jgi:hypothetical protein
MKLSTKILLFSVLFFFFLSTMAYADVTPGETINQTNWQKIQGLVPDYIVMWVKNGDMTMKIGKLDYDPASYWSDDVKANWKSNVGRYKIDENNGIIDVKTGKPAHDIKGLPFPEPDIKDPKMPVMLMWNNIFEEYFLQGNKHSMNYWLCFGRNDKSRPEKIFALEDLTYIMKPWRPGCDYAQLSVFRQPMSMAGTGTLALYPLYPLDIGKGQRFAYSTEMRRELRLDTKLTGSDDHFGFDAAPDDSWVGGPKTAINEGIYKFVREQDALIPYVVEGPLKVSWKDKNYLGIGSAETGYELKMGYNTPGWTGAPWHVTNIIWVKSKVWVFTVRSTDRSYKYGECEGWVEQGTFSHIYKRITDVNGKLWKGLYYVNLPVECTDGKFKKMSLEGQVVVDMRRDHGSVYPGTYYKGAYFKILIKNAEPTLFTAGGFKQFYK